MFTFFDHEVTIKRLSAYTDSKASYAAVAGTICGLFEAIGDSQTTIALKIQGQAYRFTADPDADIRAGDILVRNSLEYTVRGVKKYEFRGTGALAVFLEKPQKQP